MKYYYALAILIFFSLNPNAKINKVTAKKSEFFSISSFYSGKRVSFKAEKSKDNKYFILRSENGKTVAKSQISKPNLKFLIAEIKNIKSPTNEIRFCKNHYISAKIKSKSMIGCIGRRNATAKKLSSTLRLINSLI